MPAESLALTLNVVDTVPTLSAAGATPTLRLRVAPVPDTLTLTHEGCGPDGKVVLTLLMALPDKVTVNV